MRCLELFSGCGGLAKGLELAGFEHAHFVEFNKDACKTLRLNFGSELVYEGDVRSFNFKSVGKVDIVAGGPPCQPFSLGGKHKAHDDSRDMFPYAIRAIEDLNPKGFVFENVKGLLRTSFSEYFEYIIKRLTYPYFEIGADKDWRSHLVRLRRLHPSTYKGVRYDVHYKLLNAANYGVPQNRERVFIVGIRSDLERDWIFPEATHNEQKLLWDKYVTLEYWHRHGIDFSPNLREKALEVKLKNLFGIFPPEGLPWVTLRDILSSVPCPVNGAHKISDHIFKDGARIYAGHTGSDIDYPGKTIKAGGHGVPGGENMIRFMDGSVRYFTTYESKLVQTFPSDFQVIGAWGESMRQIGNAVPVTLAHIIGRRLYNLLSDCDVKDRRRYPLRVLTGIGGGW